jgi:hypothetical protein
MRAANAKVQYRENGTPSFKGWVEFCEGTTRSDSASCAGVGFDQQGRANRNLEPGNYYLVVRPRSSDYAPKTYAATVDSLGVLSVVGSTVVDGHWQITGQTPNVRFIQ